MLTRHNITVFQNLFKKSEILGAADRVFFATCKKRIFCISNYKLSTDTTSVRNEEQLGSNNQTSRGGGRGGGGRVRNACNIVVLMVLAVLAVVK